MRVTALSISLALALLAGIASAEERESPVPPFSLSTSPAGGYLACGCGCCGGIEPVKRCLPDIGSLEAAKEKDRELAYSKDCMMIGCSRGVIYRICDE